MTDAQAISANHGKIEDAISTWNGGEQDRETWLSIFVPLLRDMCGHNAEAPSGDPEDADVPECPAV